MPVALARDAVVLINGRVVLLPSAPSQPILKLSVPLAEEGGRTPPGIDESVGNHVRSTMAVNPAG